MGLIAARVAEIDFAVLDDRVVPVGDVECSIRSHLDIDGAESRVIALDDFGHLAAGISAAIILKLKPADAVAAEIVGDAVALPIARKVSAADNFESAMLGAARIETVEQASNMWSGGG